MMEQQIRFKEQRDTAMCHQQRQRIVGEAKEEHITSALPSPTSADQAMSKEVKTEDVSTSSSSSSPNEAPEITARVPSTPPELSHSAENATNNSDEISADQRAVQPATVVEEAVFKAPPAMPWMKKSGNNNYLNVPVKACPPQKPQEQPMASPVVDDWSTMPTPEECRPAIPLPPPRFSPPPSKAAPSHLKQQLPLSSEQQDFMLPPPLLAQKVILPTQVPMLPTSAKGPSVLQPPVHGQQETSQKISAESPAASDVQTPSLSVQESADSQVVPEIPAKSPPGQPPLPGLLKIQSKAFPHKPPPVAPFPEPEEPPPLTDVRSTVYEQAESCRKTVHIPGPGTVKVETTKVPREASNVYSAAVPNPQPEVVTRPAPAQAAPAADVWV